MKKTTEFLQELIETKILNEGIPYEECLKISVDLFHLSALLNAYAKDPESVFNQICDRIEKEAWNHGKPGDGGN